MYYSTIPIVLFKHPLYYSTAPVLFSHYCITQHVFPIDCLLNLKKINLCFKLYYIINLYLSQLYLLITLVIISTNRVLVLCLTIYVIHILIFYNYV